jgi:tetratricopeptide (TPR) repeat protein
MRWDPLIWLPLWLLCCCPFGLAQVPAALKFPEIAKGASEAWSQNHLEDAARLYRQAVRLKPAWAEGWGYLAASLFALKRYPEARDAYLRTAQLTPGNGPSWAYAGFCEYELRDYPHAFTHLQKARKVGLGTDPELIAHVGYELSLLWTTAGKFEMGMKEIAGVSVAENKPPPVVEATGLATLRMPLFPYEIPADKHALVDEAGEAQWAANVHHTEEARKLYEQLVAAHQNEHNVHYAYGVFLVALDQEAALKEYEKEIEIAPTHVPALVESSFLYLKMGELEKAENTAGKAAKLDPENYAPHNILGRVLMENGKIGEGIRELKLATKLAPLNPGAHFNLAQAYQQAGKKQQADLEFATFEKLNKRAGQAPAATP